MTTQETADMRSKQQVELPFGITGHPTIRLDDERKTESDELERGTKRRRKHKLADTQDADEEEEARKKARGRPRVDTKDETAADVSLFQIHLYFPFLDSLVYLQSLPRMSHFGKSKVTHGFWYLGTFCHVRRLVDICY